ncbi:glycosyltransferase, partial [Acinetobacter baumannii]
LLLVPSLWKENSPGVVFQALGTGLPIMASDRGGLPELVVPGENGFLGSAGDASAWTKAIDAVLAAPQQLEPLRIGAAASAQRYDPDR